ncbi:MAG: galactokinase family protein [Calditrichaceae bacterium]
MFIKYFGEQEMHYFSAPGRVEIGGNHTDHNNGRVLAAAINLDTIAIASPTQDDIVTLYSDGYNKPFIVDLKDKKVNTQEIGTTSALIRGIAARMDDLGDTVGGFKAVVTSDVPMGSGISSSASIELLLGCIYNALHNGGARALEMLAQIGQFAENVYFGKPCGLMDQTACAVGGIISIDFENPAIPIIKKIDSSFSQYNYSLLLVNTGDSHADLTSDYAAIPDEMKSVAEAMNQEVCRDINKDQLIEKIPELRNNLGDRAVLRALHFLDENERVLKQVLALEMRDFDRFMSYVHDSGESSFKWLQNIYNMKDSRSQSVTLALALTEQFISKIMKGVCRIHEGGFAGTIFVLIPTEYVYEYKNLMQPVFGNKCVMQLQIRQAGTIYINKLFK